ncbi:MAG TPA: hypothetical protein PLL71_04150 [Agriterribacter sp.]|nr:hypothetical protein [Agriterribacter sp.]HRQ49372.1 hypothetical protein [Agriterribacter sp.]
MKKIIPAISIIFIAHIAFSQNTFPSSGNVGIGTVSPDAGLEIIGGDANLTVLKLKGASDQAAGSSIIDIISKSTSIVGAHFVRAGNNIDLLFKATADNSIKTQISTLGMYTQGVLGVGTFDTKGYKLAVGGNMVAEKIKVKLMSNWPDYVFEQHYRLLSLSELEEFIRKNNHLPEIPSALEVEQKGLDLGENQALLLKKIEELTLYIIELKKENTAMAERQGKLETEVSKLREVQK